MLIPQRTQQLTHEMTSFIAFIMRLYNTWGSGSVSTVLRCLFLAHIHGCFLLPWEDVKVICPNCPTTLPLTFHDFNLLLSALFWPVLKMPTFLWNGNHPLFEAAQKVTKCQFFTVFPAKEGVVGLFCEI